MRCTDTHAYTLERSGVFLTVLTRLMEHLIHNYNVGQVSVEHRAIVLECAGKTGKLIGCVRSQTGE